MSDETNDTDDNGVNEPGDAELEAMLKTLKEEHRRIDIEIKALIEMGAFDMLKIGRMKKIKLSLKDQIVYIENQLTPDIIA
jgi:hypothetical protein